MDEFDGIVDANDGARDPKLIEDRAVEINRRRPAGHEYLYILPFGEKPLIVALVGETITVLGMPGTPVDQFPRDPASTR